MKKSVIFISLNIVIIIAFSLIQVVAANSISTTGIELNKIQQQIADLKKYNAELHEQVLAQSSLTYIASKAASMGFDQSVSTVVISSPLPIAAR